MFLQEIQSAFAIPLARHFGTMVFMLALAALLFFCVRAASRQAVPVGARA
jgi:hypothetical protein